MLNECTLCLWHFGCVLTHGLKIEQLIRDQGFLDAYEILELFCELVSTRMGVLEMFKWESLLQSLLLFGLLSYWLLTIREIPNDMKEAVYRQVVSTLLALSQHTLTHIHSCYNFIQTCLYLLLLLVLFGVSKSFFLQVCATFSKKMTLS